MFQSPPPRGGRLEDIANNDGLSVVSIHAPARGATRATASLPRTNLSFNPRPRAGGDENLSRPTATGKVSIHAPARGATLSLNILALRQKFQSTPPRGGRQRWLSRYFQECGFNPRPRAGGDAYFRPHGSMPCVSIHAPARGATVAWFYDKYKAQVCFNPRPRAGGDCVFRK